MMEHWERFKDKVELYEFMLVPPPNDLELDNMERQGFQTNPATSWQSTQRHNVRDKAVFDLSPTNPQTDIKATGRCDISIRTLQLIVPNDYERCGNNLLSIPISASNRACLPNTREATAAYVYKSDGKCIGMTTPERFHLLRDCYYKAQAAGAHNKIEPPPQNLASEIMALLHHHNNLISTTDQTIRKRAKDSQTYILPAHISKAFQKWVLITKENMASPLDFSPEISTY